MDRGTLRQLIQEAIEDSLRQWKGEMFGALLTIGAGLGALLVNPGAAGRQLLEGGR